MVRINNLRDSPQVRQKRDQDKQARSAPIGSSSVTRPNRRLRIGANGQGGYLESDGRFYWQGVIDLDGPVTVTMSLDVSGDTTIGGSVAITEDLDVSAQTVLRGLTTLLSDLVVFGDGRIQVGSSMTLDPSESNGALKFSNGGQVFTDGDSIQVYKGNAVVQLQDDSAKLQYGGAAIVINNEGIHLYGAVYAHNLPTITDDANAFADPSSGRLGKTAD